MQTPQSLAEAKAVFKAETFKLSTSFSALIGSRWLLAIAAAFAIAFASHLAFAPERLPPVGGLNLASAGLPPSVDFGLVGEQAAKAREAALAQGAPGEIQALIDDNREWAPLANGVGLALALLVLGANLTVMTKRRRQTRG